MNRLLLIILTFAIAQAYPQCLPPAELAVKIGNIEESALTNNKKIAILRSLADAQLKCIGKKDSLYARAMHRIGDLYRLEGNLNKAFEFTNAAITINRSGNAEAQPSYLANSYYNLGIYYNLLGQPVQSMRSFDSCIYFGSGYNDKHIIAQMAYEQKSFLYFQGGDYQESINTAKEGAKFARKNNDEFYESVLVIQEAQSQLALGDLARAETNIKTSIEKLINDPSEYLATAYSVYAAVLKKNEKHNSAKNYYIKAFELNKEFGNWPQCSRDLLDLGYLYDHYFKDGKKALAEYNKAMKYAVLAGDKYLQAALYTNIGYVYWGQKDHKEALSNYQHALNILPMGFDDPDWQTNPSFEKLQTISNDYYLATLLFNKAQALLDLSGQEQNNRLLDGSLNTFLLADKVMTKMRWKQLYDESKLFWRKETKDMYEKAIEACYLSHNLEKAFYFFEKSRAVLLRDKLLKLSYDTVITLPDAQARLKSKNQTLVEYFTGDSVVYILAIGETNKFLRIPVNNFKSEAARLLAICSNPTLNNQRFGEYSKIATNLYHQIFQPLRISSKRIIISPGGEPIPFEILLAEDGPLLKKFAISYTYSAELLFRKQTRENTAGSFLGIAPVNYKKYLSQPSLNGSGASLNTIGNFFNRPELLINEAATRSAFFKNFPHYKIVQLYSHGYSEGNDPVLYFNDSTVKLSEIQQTNNIGTEMIALSACETGTGKIAEGEGVFSFARGFYAAGIPSLLTTLWQVDDRSTYSITELFYKHLQKGMERDEALRQAKLEFMENNDKLYQLPYYWSSYILIGSTGNIIEETPNELPVIYIVSAILLIYILYITLKKVFA